MFSKYTTAFFAPSILLWLCLVPARAKWLRGPWPWAAGSIALLIFSPVIVWNAQHEWASFAYQTHRMVVRAWSLRYPAELVGSQIALLTPSVFVLGCIGAFWLLRQKGQPLSARVLLGAIIAPIPIYFLWHSLHERVQGNWPEPIYPALAVLAAAAAHALRGRTDLLGRTASWSLRCAGPVSIVLVGIACLQAAFGIVPLGRHDPGAKVLAAGMPELAARVDAVRKSVNAPVILVSDYTLAGWLAFYLPSHAPVEEINERIRWIDAPQPPSELFRGQMLYVCKGDCPDTDALKRRFRVVERLASLSRQRKGEIIMTYAAYRLADPITPIFDPVYPAMNLGVRE